MKLTATMREEKRPNGTVILFSYSTRVAAKLPDGSYVRTSQKYSKTTSEHLNAWCPNNAKLVPQSEVDAL